MTFKEFMFWFEGYSEAIMQSPNKEQWEKIKDKLKKVDHHDDEKKKHERVKEIVPYPVYVKEYVYPPYPPYFINTPLMPIKPLWTVTCQSSDIQAGVWGGSHDNNTINIVQLDATNNTCVNQSLPPMNNQYFS